MKEFSTYMEDHIMKLLNTSNITVINRLIHSYIDMNNEILSEAGLYKLVFSELEQNKLFRLFKTSSQEIKAEVKKSSYIDPKWNIGANPYNLLIGAIIRALLIIDEKKYQKTIENLTTYLLLKLYPSRFANSFPNGVIRQVMEYTVNHMSYKFALKEAGTLLGAVKAMALPLIENFRERLKKLDDKNLVDFVNDAHNRMNSFVKKIAEVYYEVHKSGKYLNTQQDQEDEDTMVKADNVQFIINRIQLKVTTQINANGVEHKLVNSAASYNQISSASLLVAVDQLYRKKVDEIPNMVELILSVYSLVSPNMTEREINSKKFLYESIRVYKKNNTNDTKIIKIKEILDTWLKECSDFYLKCNREATLNNFKRALYMYFLFIIMVYSGR